MGSILIYNCSNPVHLDGAAAIRSSICKPAESLHWLSEIIEEAEGLAGCFISIVSGSAMTELAKFNKKTSEFALCKKKVKNEKFEKQIRSYVDSKDKDIFDGMFTKNVYYCEKCKGFEEIETFCIFECKLFTHYYPDFYCSNGCGKLKRIVETGEEDEKKYMYFADNTKLPLICPECKKGEFLSFVTTMHFD